MACMPSTYNVQTKWLAENNPDSDHLDENSFHNRESSQVMSAMVVSVIIRYSNN